MTSMEQFTLNKPKFKPAEANDYSADYSGEIGTEGGVEPRSEVKEAQMKEQN
jgi:hypothetical protein